jgi:hypothetical protein
MFLARCFTSIDPRKNDSSNNKCLKNYSSKSWTVKFHGIKGFVELGWSYLLWTYVVLSEWLDGTTFFILRTEEKEVKCQINYFSICTKARKLLRNEVKAWGHFMSRHPFFPHYISLVEKTIICWEGTRYWISVFFGSILYQNLHCYFNAFWDTICSRESLFLFMISSAFCKI